MYIPAVRCLLGGVLAQAQPPVQLHSDVCEDSSGARLTPAAV